MQSLSRFGIIQLVVIDLDLEKNNQNKQLNSVTTNKNTFLCPIFQRNQRTQLDTLTRFIDNDCGEC